MPFFLNSPPATLLNVSVCRFLIAGKLHLQGTIAQKFDQLDKRETELLEDTEKQRVMVKRLKDDRAHYRKKCEDKE